MAAKRIYLAGPMSGYPNFNFSAFHAAAALLRHQGAFVFSPAENDLVLYGSDFLEHPERADFRKCMEDDLRWICRYADAIALLPGWEKSKGVGVEKTLADALNLEVIYIGSNGR